MSETIETLRAERDAALAREAALAEVMALINTTPDDPQPVFDAILAKAHQLCDAAVGALFIFDGTHFQAVATLGYPPDVAAKLREKLAPTKGLQRLIDGDRFSEMADMSVQAAAGRIDRNSFIAAFGVRSHIGVPLRKNGVLQGYFTANRLEVRPYSEREKTLLEAFAAQAVTALENARLLTEQREALDRQTATAEILRIINASPGNLVPVFDAILEKAHLLCGADCGDLATYDGEIVTSIAVRGVPKALEEVLRAGFRPGRQPDATYQLPDIGELVAQGWGPPALRMAYELAHCRTFLAVPLIKDGVPLGRIVAFRTQIKPFSDKEIALLESFAAQAVIAMENARLLDEQREALERQTATAEILQVINASPGNLTPVFDIILEKAHLLCGATMGALMIVESTQIHTVATRGIPDAFVAFRTRHPATGEPGTPSERVLTTRRPVNVADLTEEHLFKQGQANLRAFVELAGVRALAMVPLLKEGAVTGFFAIMRKDPGAFSDKQIALLESFAAQAVIAMENARLLDEQREALEHQTATAEILQVINASPGNLAPVFDVILEKAHLLCGAEGGSLAFYDGEFVSSVAVRGMPDALNTMLRAGFRPGRNLDTTYQIPDIAEAIGQSAAHPVLRATFEIGQFRTFLSVPLIKDKELLGRIVALRRQTKPFADKEIALLESFAAQAVIAIENARLLTEVRAARDAAETALHDLKSAQASLVQAEKMASLGQLTAGIAHEIKNPLNFVNNFASLSVDLLAEFQDIAAPALASLDESARADLTEVAGMLSSNLKKITEHGKRADGIVRGMLEHSRSSSGERREVELNAVVEDALLLAFHGARAQDSTFNITLQRDYAENLAPISLVPQDISRVLINLCSNGFYAAHKRAQTEGPGFAPTVSVRTRELGDAVEIVVQDNGTGIPKEIQDKLFQPFFTTKPTGEGTGLGLSISYDVVTQQHGGTIFLASEIGVGASFTVRLPRLPGAAARSA